jgi:serine/threonine-protein kinase
LQGFHHARNLGHGDIKPENLLLMREPNRLVLIDYGSAWPIEETWRRDSGDGITKHYAAPETLDNPGAGDFRSDQFSLSLVFYELLTLELPFEGVGGQAGRQEYRASFEGKLVHPSELSPDRERLPPGIWPAIDRLVTRGLAFDPGSRFGAPRDWLKEFDTIDAELRRGTRLGPINGLIVRWFDWLARRGPEPAER